MQLLATNSELFSVSFEVVALSRTLTNISEDTDGSPVPVPFGATDLAAALSLISSVSSDTTPVFDSFTSICDAIVSITWFDASLAEKKLSKTAADMLSAVKTSPGTRSAGKAMRELLGAPNDLGRIHKRPEPLFTKPASVVDDTCYSVASHLYVEELVELKSVSMEWKDVSRSVLCSVPLSWTPPPSAALQSWERTMETMAYSDFKLMHRAINGLNPFQAASLLTSVAELFFSHLEEWVNVPTWGFYRTTETQYVTLFLHLLRRAHPDAIAPHMRNIVRLCELPFVVEEYRDIEHVLLEDVPIRIFDAEVAVFVERKHPFVARCSKDAVHPHLNTLVDLYASSCDAFRVAILGCVSDDVSVRVLSIISRPVHSFDRPECTLGAPGPSKEENAITEMICNLGASTLKNNSMLIMNVLNKLHGNTRTRGQTKRIVDTFEQVAIDAFASSITFENDDFFPHFMMRVDDNTIASRADEIFSVPMFWASAVPDLLYRLPPTVWYNLYRNGVVEESRREWRECFARIDEDTFMQHIRPFLVEGLMSERDSLLSLDFFHVLPLFIRKKHVGMIVELFDVRTQFWSEVALRRVLPGIVSEEHVPFIIQRTRNGNQKVRVSAIECLRREMLLSDTILQSLFEVTTDVDVLVALVKSITNVQPFEGTLCSFLSQRGPHSFLACQNLSLLSSCDEEVCASLRMCLRYEKMMDVRLDKGFIERNISVLAGWLSEMKRVWSIELVLQWLSLVDCSPIVSEMIALFNHESNRVKSNALFRFQHHVSREIQTDNFELLLPLIDSPVKTLAADAIDAIAKCGCVLRCVTQLLAKAAQRGPVGVAARRAMKGAGLL